MGVKDFFTLINLMGGVAGIYFVLEGRLETAAVALLLGYVFGDSLDGMVARATGTANRFGSALDSETDHLTQAVVPGIIVFGVYRQGGHAALGFAIMSALIACGTFRHALFAVAKLDDPLMYCGLPRTVSGFAAMSFVLSRFFFQENPWAFTMGAVLIPALAAAGLLPIPYMTHRGTRRMQGYVKLFVVGVFVTPAIALFVRRDLMFDVLFLWMMLYALAAWAPLHLHERKAFYERYRRWASEVSH